MEKPRPALLRGQHLIAAGLTAGPRFAELIRESLSAQDDGEFDDEAGAAGWLERRLGRG
ncbi:hypothetical protein [Sinomonas sp. G460-2]|uniref:hypothetical protein n=1 Tax=Sinomonas sp. G460-2 TaxID=3393464 RepID=UPI0039EE99DA